MLLVVPGPDPEPWPTLGPQVCDFLEEVAVYGPGSLQGQPYVIDLEFRAWLYRCYEVYPKGHPWAGRRRFKRAALSVRKGLAKTEKEALVVLPELHPEGPVRCDGFDANGDPVGRPVVSPYIPMLAVSVDQVEELAYGALSYIIAHGPDADLFDVSQERILRLDEYGREDGKAVPLANSPGSRDGARTTLNAFDEPHRLYLPRQLAAHETMQANLPKRPLEDPWSLYVGTAGQPGQGSIAEGLHNEALQIQAGKIERADLFYLYRTDDGGHDLTDKRERIVAISQATGPAGEWGPGQFDDIASQWDRPGADTAYLERVWLNRWRRSAAVFFDPLVIADHLAPGTRIPEGAFVTLGFDGARRRDATALVATDITTGVQELLALWERPEDVEDWEVPAGEVHEAVDGAFDRFAVWKLYADPPYWIDEVGAWAARHPDQVEEWWTNRYFKVAYALRAYRDSIANGHVTFAGIDVPGAIVQPHADLIRHLAAAGAREINGRDGEGRPLHILDKQPGQEWNRFDAAMAAFLSWTACLDARKKGATPPAAASFVPFRVR